MADKVIISKSKMISLADAIRSKTGILVPLSIDNIIQVVRALDNGEGTNTPIGGLYQTGAVEAYKTLGDEAINDLLITSWDDLISNKTIINNIDEVIPGQVLPELPEKNQYGFYFGVPYNYPGSEYSIKFFEDGSVEEIFEGESNTYPAGSAVYSQNTADMTNPDIDYDIAYFSEDGTIMTWWDEKYYVGSPIFLNGDLFIPNNTYGAQPNFSSQTLLTGVVLPKNLTYINWNAFSGCTSLTEIIIPNSVTSIDGYAFRGCTSLAEIVIPESVTSIGESAFEGCENIQNIELPNSVTSIGEYAFADCTSLTSVYYAGTPEDWCNIEFNYGSNPIGYAEHLYMKDFNNEYYEVTEIEIPNTIKSIGFSQFSGFSNLTKVTILSSVTSIGEYAFEYCTSLAKIVIPESVTSIDYGAFKNCTGLTEIVIPNSVTSIGSYAFKDCTGLTEIVILNSATSIGNYAFDRCTNVEFLQVPFSSTINQLFSLFRDTSSLTSLKKVVITNGTSIGETAFFNCTSLTEVVIPDSVTIIDYGAFRNCKSLTEIVIPNSVTSIGYYVFNGCTSLTEIVIPNSVTSIGGFAFGSCVNLTKINYMGTIAQWNSISKGGGWDNSTGTYTIYCTDGTINK